MVSNYDAWLEAPYTDVEEPCEACDDEGCHLCDEMLAAEYAADIELDRMKDEGRR